MKPSSFQSPRATPSRGRLKDAGLPLTRRPDTNSGESNIRKIAAKGASEDSSRSSVDLADRSPEEKSAIEELQEKSPASDLLRSSEVEDDGVLGYGASSGGGSPSLFPVKEEEEEDAEVPDKVAAEGAEKAECPATAAETPATASNVKSLHEMGRSVDSIRRSKPLLDAATEVATGGGGVSRAADGRSGSPLSAMVWIGVISFLIGCMGAEIILAVTAFLGGRCCGFDGFSSRFPPT